VGPDARALRLSRPWGSVPTAALLGDVDPSAVRAGGWEVRGRLAADPFRGRPTTALQDVAGYLDAAELLDDARVDAAVVDAADPDLAGLLPLLREAGLLLLLPTPAPLDVDVLRAVRAVEGPEACAGLVARWEPWARTVSAALPLAGGVPVQVTVRGWPPGAAAGAELADLVRGWCGEVAAVVAAPGPLPAAALPGGEPVDWALLTASGATVLVAHAGPAPSVRLSFATARLEAGPAGVRWVDGAELPLLRLPDWVPPVPRGVPPGLVATAAALSEALGGAALPEHGDGVAPADLGDLLVAARVVEALQTSARTERLVPTA
jgi:hypothetical protein